MHFASSATSLVLWSWYVIQSANGFVPQSPVHIRLAAVSSAREKSGIGVASVEGGVDNGVSSSSWIQTPDMEAYAAGYKTPFEEVPCSVCKPKSGELPADLVGTYFRSGPAMFSAGSLPPPKTSLVQPKTPVTPDGTEAQRMVQHPFEGDGAILGITLRGDNTATARYRYVRTNAFQNERRKGQRLYTGMDSTRAAAPVSNGHALGNDFPLPMYRHHLQTGLNKKRKNTSNTRALYWAKKLITLWEGGLPYKLDALGLSTEGRSQLGGVIKDETTPFGAAAVYDSNSHRMIFHSNAQDAKASTLTIMEFNSKFRLVNSLQLKMDGFAIISDFAITQDYAIVVQAPLAVNNMQFLLTKEPAKSLNMDASAPALLHVVPRNGGPTKTIQIPNDGISDAELQYCNAYQQGEGKDATLVMDVIRSDGRNIKSSTTSWPWATTTKEYTETSSNKSLWRYTIDLSNSGSVHKECITDLQTMFGVINPEYSGREHRYVYATVGGMGSQVAPPQGIVKVDVQTKSSEVWMPEEFEFCGEPMYAPRKTNENGNDNKESQGADIEKEEDGGYILSVLFNGKTEESELLVLEADKIANGPVARVPLGVAVPHGLFGCFSSADEASWAADEIDRRAKLADKMESRGNMWNEVKSDFSGLGLRLDDWDEYFGDIL